MKKIVMGIAVVACAASMFAADISSATKISGKLFDFDASKNLSLFTERNDSHDYANPNFTMSISDDKAGATVKITTNNYGGENEGTVLTTQTIWFKPVDALKITVGNYDVALNKEQIDWTESKTGLGGNGFLASVNANGFGLDIGLAAHDKTGFWFSKADGVDPVLKNIFVKAAYSADFGTIGGFFTYETVPAVAAAAAKTEYYLDTESGAIKSKTTAAVEAKNAGNKMLFGAGYRNNFSGVDAFLNVVGSMGEKFEWVRPELYVSGKVDALGYQLFAAPLIYTESGKDAECELLAKVTYAMDGVTPYVYFKDANLLAKTFAATVKVGATGSVGLMGWNCWLEIAAAEKPAFSIPFELTVSF